MKRPVKVTHTKTMRCLEEGVLSAAVRVITCPSREPNKPRIQARAERSLADSSRSWSCVDGTASLLEFAIAGDRRGFGLESLGSVVSDRDSQAVAAIAARCPGFPTEGI